jgi:hypothetical protein
LLAGNLYAILPACARALNPCVVALGSVHLAQPNVRGVAGSKPSRRKTFTVILAVSKYLGVSPVVPADTRQVARREPTSLLA